jgi:DNA-binding CsgD family transcriptional regulator
MASTLTFDRVRSDIDVLSRAGLDVGTFMAEVAESVGRAVPHVATCMATCDPATNMVTSVFKFGDLYGQDDQDHLWGLIEYGVDDPTSFAELLRADFPAAGMHLSTNGAAGSIHRIEELITPYYGYADELRLVGRAGSEAWGGIAVFRGSDDEPFSTAEVEFMASLSGAYAAGLRTGILAEHSGSGGTVGHHGPIVLVVGADDQLRQMSAGAEDVLTRLSSGPNRATASSILYSLVAGARRYAAGTVATPPRARVRMDDGRWLVLHSSPLTSADGTGGDVVITVEEARPPEIVPLVVAAFGLTARERDVVQLVLQGEGTKQIATALHMSRYTVQDHLKSIFDKADVRSRRELVARIYFDQYAERMGHELAPSGWFRPGGALDAAPAGG